MYTTINFKTKKALKEAIAAGRKVSVFQPGPFGGKEPKSGTVFLEGPHYPAPHSWYAEATLVNGYVTKVKNPKGSRMTKVTVNPKAKCPKCGRFMKLHTTYRGVRTSEPFYYCSHCGTTKSIKGGNPMAKTSNPKKGQKKCPICGKFSDYKWQAGGWYCPKHKWFFPSDLRTNIIGGNPMAKRKRTRQMKILGIPVMTAAIVGGLAYWLFKKKS